MSEMPINPRISPLRRRMIEDMTVRQFVEKTQADYIRHVRTFTAFLGRAPDTATADDLRRFQLHQAETGVRPPSINGAVAALRFFFTVSLDRPELARGLVFVREPRKIPVVLSTEEVADLLEAAPGPKYKAALAAGYGAGLKARRFGRFDRRDGGVRRGAPRHRDARGIGGVNDAVPISIVADLVAEYPEALAPLALDLARRMNRLRAKLAAAAVRR